MSLPVKQCFNNNSKRVKKIHKCRERESFAFKETIEKRLKRKENEKYK